MEPHRTHEPGMGNKLMAHSRAWALAGHGIARKTIWDAAADIRAGRLESPVA